MPLDKTRVAELEAEIDDERLSEVRFGRSSFLRNAGLALFGLSAGLFATPPREAAAAAVGRPPTLAEETIAGESVSDAGSTGVAIGST